jgi:hypothetical protein
MAGGFPRRAELHEVRSYGTSVTISIECWHGLLYRSEWVWRFKASFTCVSNDCGLIC